ncbi:hypothetical protein BC832DRAFT_592200 [Gaertneriomyces semiglobifer]|nr:hypothetical protein BC832DRAFT_592200 [Gaertneriomyces semiglobifer]
MADTLPTPTLHSLPSELHYSIFSYLVHPHQLSLSCHSFAELADSAHAHRLWLYRNAFQLESELARKVSFRSYDAGSDDEGESASSSGVCVPRIVHSNRKFMQMFVEARGCQLDGQVSRWMLTRAVNAGYEEVVDAVLRIDCVRPTLEQMLGSALVQVSTTSPPSDLALHRRAHRRIPVLSIEPLLFRSTHRGQVEVIKAILRFRPDACTRTHVLGDIALKAKQTKVVEVLLEETEWDPFADPRSNAVLWACMAGEEMARLILTRWRDLQLLREPTSPVQNTPLDNVLSEAETQFLDRVIQPGNSGVMQLLLDYGYLDQRNILAAQMLARKKQMADIVLSVDRWISGPSQPP